MHETKRHVSLTMLCRANVWPHTRYRHCISTYTMYACMHTIIIWSSTHIIAHDPHLHAYALCMWSYVHIRTWLYQHMCIHDGECLPQMHVCIHIHHATLWAHTCIPICMDTHHIRDPMYMHINHQICKTVSLCISAIINYLWILLKYIKCLRDDERKQAPFPSPLQPLW